MIQRIAVVGAGTMGAGIAQLCAQSGCSVKIYDAVPEASCRAAGRIKEGLDRAALKGKLTLSQSERAYAAVAFAKEMKDLFGADLVLEAAGEDLELKRKIFSELDAVCPDAILATNTSSLSVAAIAEAVKTPERVLGMHFFNPPISMKLVEMARAPKTRPEVFREAWDFVVLGLRKTPFDVKDTPGFIVNRVMRPFYLGGMREAAEAGGISALDKTVKDLGRLPMGPLELMDLIGLDVNLAITKAIYESLGRPERLKPHPMQERLVELGHAGRKSGKGFYVYGGRGIEKENPEASKLLAPAPRLKPEATWGRVLHGIVVEAQHLFEEGVAGKADIDAAVKLAMNFPKGPFEWLKEYGPAKPAPTAS